LLIPVQLITIKLLKLVVLTI